MRRWWRQISSNTFAPPPPSSSPHCAAPSVPARRPGPAGVNPPYPCVPGAIGCSPRARSPTRLPSVTLDPQLPLALSWRPCPRSRLRLLSPGPPAKAAHRHRPGARRGRAHGGRRGVAAPPPAPSPRRDDGSEGNGGGPGKGGHHPARDDRHGGHREPDGDQRQAGDAAPVLPKVSRRGVEGGVEEHWRHEQRQGELRIERHARCVGEQREGCPRQRQERGIRDIDPAGPGRQHGAHEQQRNDELEDGHGVSARRCCC